MRRLSQLGYELRNRVAFCCWSGSTKIYFRQEVPLHIDIYTYEIGVRERAE